VTTSISQIKAVIDSPMTNTQLAEYLAIVVEKQQAAKAILGELNSLEAALLAKYDFVANPIPGYTKAGGVTFPHGVFSKDNPKTFVGWKQPDENGEGYGRDVFVAKKLQVLYGELEAGNIEKITPAIAATFLSDLTDVSPLKTAFDKMNDTDLPVGIKIIKEKDDEIKLKFSPNK